jgi:hypothetical protein
MYTQESSLHTYYIENGYRITNAQYIIYLPNNILQKIKSNTLRSIAAGMHHNTTDNQLGAIACLEHHIEVLQISFSFWVAGKNSKIEYTYGWYSTSVENNDMQSNNDNKDKVVIRFNVEKHIYLTLKSRTPIYYVKIAGWNYPLSLIITKCGPQKGLL